MSNSPENTASVQERSVLQAQSGFMPFGIAVWLL
jgi:hypothetical protein